MNRATKSNGTGLAGKRIAITGGAGFLGFHLAHAAAAHGIPIRLLDIAPFDPKEYPEGTEFATVDVRDRSALEEAFHDARFVVHAAAALPLWRREEILSTNLDGTLRVLQAAAKEKIERVVQISSTAVYGVPRVHPLDENAPLHGVGPYGETKVAAEALCRAARERGMVVPILRPKTFLGSGRLGVFQILYDWVRSGKRIPVIGNGRNRYQLLAVEDLVDAIFLALEAPADAANETFNVGANRFGTVRDDLTALCNHASSGAQVVGTPAPLVKGALALFEALHLSPLYKWVYGTADRDSYVATDRIESALGWMPRFSNADTLIRSYNWYLENEHSIRAGTGVTHRIAWDPGVLRFFKRWM